MCVYIYIYMLQVQKNIIYLARNKKIVFDDFGSFLLSSVVNQVLCVRQIWSEMQNDFLPNFVLCNTTQRFIRSSKVPHVPVQKPSVPYAKPNFYCGTEVRTYSLTLSFLFFNLLPYIRL